MNINEILRNKIKEFIQQEKIVDTKISVKNRVLTEKESIGDPLHRDYPLIKGKEKLIEADYKGYKGVAFTDMYGEYEDYLYNIIDMKLTNNFRRAIFISVINAVLRSLNKAQKTEHCKNEQLIECKNQLKDYITKNYGNPKILQVGHQPRFTELLTAEFDTKVLDLDKDNIDKKVNNIKINNGELWQNFLDDIDLIFITGSSFVNDTAEQYIKLNKNIVFYGVTCAAPCYLLDLPRYCPEGN